MVCSSKGEGLPVDSCRDYLMSICQVSIGVGAAIVSAGPKVSVCSTIMTLIGKEIFDELDHIVR